MPIYTASTIESGKPQSSEFTSRGISGLTQAQLSSVPIYGKADTPEIAYAGYKANIDMFLLATIEGRRLRVDTEGRGAPMNQHIDAPFAVVNVAFNFVKEPSEEGLAKITAALETYGFGAVAMTKTSSVYTCDNIPVNIVVDKLARLTKPTAGTPKGYCTIEAAVASYYLFLGIESFLAVNTYPYARNNTDDEENEEDDWLYDIRHVYELGVRKAQENPSEELPKKKKAKRTKTKKGPAVEITEVDVDMDDDDVPDDEKHYFSSGMNEVMYAKPTTYEDAHKNHGAPSQCPKLPGLVFPYFEGLIANDPKFVRSKTLDLFFRFLGIEKEDESPRSAYKTFRNAIISFTGTDSGLVVQHILKGIELALDTQTQLYVLNEGKNYLGFVLCGGMFHVFHQGSWVAPMDRKDLQKELSDILTHDFALELLALELNAMKLAHDGSAPMIDVTSIDTPLKLATKMGLLKWEQDEEGLETEKRISDAMKRLSFSNVKSWNIDNLEHTLGALNLLFTNDPLPDDLPITLPLANFQHCAKRSFLVFSSFGTKAFSFREVGKGVEYAVPRTEEEIAKFMEKEGEGDKAKLKIPGIILCLKSPQQCMLDWDQFLAKGSMRYNLKERAAVSKNKMYSEKGMKKILDALLAGVTLGAFKVDKGKGRATGDSTGTALMSFGDGEIDDFF